MVKILCNLCDGNGEYERPCQCFADLDCIHCRGKGYYWQICDKCKGLGFIEFIMERKETPDFPTLDKNQENLAP
jgi:DnaJ-class molecular chaperone